MKQFHKTIIFTKTPLTGYFRYKDVFQIYPADLKNMPYSKLQRHHPVILEYWTDGDVDIKVPEELSSLKELYLHTATTLTSQDKIISILSVLTNHLFFRYYDLTGTWGMPILNDEPSDEEANKWSSKWNMKQFHWAELPEQLQIDKFLDPEVNKVQYIPHFYYYTQSK